MSSVRPSVSRPRRTTIFYPRQDYLGKSAPFISVSAQKRGRTQTVTIKKCAFYFGKSLGGAADTFGDPSERGKSLRRLTESVGAPNYTSTKEHWLTALYLMRV